MVNPALSSAEDGSAPDKALYQAINQPASHVGQDEGRVHLLQADEGGCGCSECCEHLDPGSSFVFYLVTTLFLLASYGIAMIVHDLGVVLAFVGATGSTMVCYILPGATYFYLHPEPHPKRILAGIQLGLGCVIVPVALVFIFLPSSD